MVSWVMVTWELVERAMPKSVTLTLPSRSTITFWGLMSRWIIPRLWACFQTLKNLRDKVQRFTPVEAATPLVHVLLQGDAVNEFHDNELPAVHLADVIDRHNIGVGEHGHSLGLVVEPAAQILVRSQLAF